MAKPNSRATLISYCKRALGHPVIEINVDDILENIIYKNKMNLIDERSKTAEIINQIVTNVLFLVTPTRLITQLKHPFLAKLVNKLTKKYQLIDHQP